MPLSVHRHPENQGLGATIRDGLKLAAERCGDRDMVIAMDADNSHTPGLIRTMTRLVLEGNDVVIASRYQRGAYVRGLSLSRQLLSYGARILFQVFFPIPGVRDYTCGYRAYRGGVLREAFRRYGNEFISEGGFQCMVDILLKLRSMNVIIRECPLILRYDFKAGASKMKVADTIWRTLELLVRRRFGGMSR
jgi:dolichol-phosphate mannosyltransferase